MIVARRDSSEKEPCALSQLAAVVPGILEEIQAGMLAEATSRRDSATVEVSTVPEALEVAQSGFARIPWAMLDGAGVAELATKAVTVRCLQDADGDVPLTEDDPGVTALVARAY